MNNFINPFNLILWFVVIIFWATAVLLSRSNGRPASPRLVMVPLCFLLIGMGINRYMMPWGTYMVCIIHVLMLPALLKVAKSKP